MSGPITIELPTPPSVNAMYRNVPGRGRVKSRAYRLWLLEADAFLLARMQRLPEVRGTCEVAIKIPSHIRGDVSNRIKACEDYLVSRGITDDDKHNRKVSIERDSSITVCLVTITPITE